MAAIIGAAYFAREVVVPKTMRKEDLLIRRVFSDDDGALHRSARFTTDNGARALQPLVRRRIGPRLYWSGYGHGC
ncbi:hypothetical protein ACW0JT_19255 [Arthrobacter sp. SA17]